MIRNHSCDCKPISTQKQNSVCCAYLALSPEQRDVLRVFVHGLKVGKPLVGTYEAVLAHPSMSDKDFSQALDVLMQCIKAHSEHG